MREAIDNGLAPALEEAGTELAADGTIPFAASRSTTPRSPPWSAASRPRRSTRSSRVGNFYFNGAFMTEAQKQDYHPTYVMSDLSEGTDDLILKFAPAEQLDHAIGASWKGKPPDPVPTDGGPGSASTTYAPDGRGIGDARRSAPRRPASSSDLAAPGLEGAGEQPTRGSFIDGDGGPRRVHHQRRRPGSFGPDDHTMPDQVRLVRFDLAGCQCWTADGDWVDVG